MSGHPRVIGYLQRALDHEFSAAQQFTLQAGQADVLGLPALAAELRTAASEELAHAGAFVVRLYAIGATPRAGTPAHRRWAARSWICCAMAWRLRSRPFDYIRRPCVSVSKYEIMLT